MPSLLVRGKNIRRGGNRRVSYLDQVYVDVYGVSVRFLQKKAVLVSNYCSCYCYLFQHFICLWHLGWFVLLQSFKEIPPDRFLAFITSAVFANSPGTSEAERLLTTIFEYMHFTPPVLWGGAILWNVLHVFFEDITNIRLVFCCLKRVKSEFKSFSFVGEWGACFSTSQSSYWFENYNELQGSPAHHCLRTHCEIWRQNSRRYKEAKMLHFVNIDDMKLGFSLFNSFLFRNYPPQHLQELRQRTVWKLRWP